MDQRSDFTCRWKNVKSNACIGTLSITDNLGLLISAFLRLTYHNYSLLIFIGFIYSSSPSASSSFSSPSSSDDFGSSSFLFGRPRRPKVKHKL